MIVCIANFSTASLQEILLLATKNLAAKTPATKSYL